MAHCTGLLNDLPCEYKQRPDVTPSELPKIYIDCSDIHSDGHGGGKMRIEFHQREIIGNVERLTVDLNIQCENFSQMLTTSHEEAIRAAINHLSSLLKPE